MDDKLNEINQKLEKLSEGAEPKVEEKQPSVEEIVAAKLAEETTRIREELQVESKKQQEETIQKMVDSLTGKTREDREREGKMTTWEREGRQPNLQEYTEFMQAKTKETVEELLSKREQEKIQKTTEIQEAEKRLNEQWDNEMAVFRKIGAIPEDPEGVKDMWAQFTDWNNKNVKEGKKLETSLLPFMASGDYKARETKVAGADAPIIGKSTASIAKDKKSYSYADIHNSRDIDSLLEKLQ